MSLTDPIQPSEDSDMPSTLPYRIKQVYFCIGNLITTYHDTQTLDKVYGGRLLSAVLQALKCFNNDHRL